MRPNVQSSNLYPLLKLPKNGNFCFYTGGSLRKYERKFFGNLTNDPILSKIGYFEYKKVFHKQNDRFMQIDSFDKYKK